MGDSLGDRMKRYEKVTSTVAMRRTPLMIRVDGKAFHTFTKGCDKPFDQHLIDSMVHAAKATASKMEGFKLGYVQSDEATFVLTDYDDLKTQGWFDYKIQKIASITAAMMTAHFNHYYALGLINFPPNLAFFDARVFNVPHDEVANNFLWRSQDWSRNSLQMMARAHFSHKELHKKNREDMHNMLHEKGLNWATDITEQQRNGTTLVKDGGEVAIRFGTKPLYTDWRKLIEEVNIDE